VVGKLKNTDQWIIVDHCKRLNLSSAAETLLFNLARSDREGLSARHPVGAGRRSTIAPAGSAQDRFPLRQIGTAGCDRHPEVVPHPGEARHRRAARHGHARQAPREVRSSWMRTLKTATVSIADLEPGLRSLLVDIRAGHP
jgi:hypothetical protein